MWEVLPATALKLVGLNHVNQMRNRSYHKLNCVDDSRPNFNLWTFKREHLISYKMFDSLVAENLNIKMLLIRFYNELNFPLKHA